VEYGTGHKVSDDEGRVIQLDFGDTRLINAYFPSGTSGDERQSFKYVWLDEFNAYLTNLKKQYPKLIVCGDLTSRTKKLTFTIRKAIKNRQVFCLKKGMDDEIFRQWLDRYIQGISPRTASV
jgi:exodeoxyribonuclease-3